MRLPKYDVLMPPLFVALIFPAAAGGWWRYFSGHADQIANPAVRMQMALPGAVAKASETGNTLLAAHPIAYQVPAGARGRRTTMVSERKSAPDATESYMSPNKPQACGITQASSGFDGFYLSAEAGE
jgi:hypothetical protein